ncbi:MAG: hypothetical protein CL537_07810 [Alcanivoracaceae bacterium]|nr:hypothetical protein [Alcanivoracaceae bacterium]|tara:strand:+ start:802 stop:1191 length:390 start_codon:yes stop_codon:yes gene_type:complete
MDAGNDRIPTTIDLLNMVKELIAKEKGDGKPVSDYALSKRLGFSSQRVYKLTDGTYTLDDEGCEVVSKLLDWPLETVLACVYLERSKRAEKETLSQAWERVCLKVVPSFAPAFIGLSGILVAASHLLPG